MSLQQPLWMAAGAQLLTVDAADFDGASRLYRATDFTGNADSATGIFSCWVRFDGNPFLMEVIADRNASALQEFIIYTNANRITLFASDGGSNSMNVSGTVTSLTTGAWYHWLLSWNTASGAQVYLNDVSEAPSVSITAPFNIDYAKTTEWAVGAAPNGGASVNGGIAEVYFAPGQYLDFSIISNRRKFISAGGRPVYMGSDGAWPTGTAPLVYLHLADGETASNFATNNGTGGNFSVVGTLTTYGSSPSG